LNGPSLEIVSRCDGTHTVTQIVHELQKLYLKPSLRASSKTFSVISASSATNVALDFQ